ncbi:oligosaccharide biosynthesis protein Alg14 like-domain-containing protein [Nemania sp. FL0916]|nr:oligosaccharide biosynthesis protein Alg14 like-domain-containing protein [Nemania sp. FL0916]
MSTNRDQAVQAIVGGSINDLIKSSISLAAVLGTTLTLAAIVLRFLGRSSVSGGTMLASIVALLFLATYLTMSTEASTVRGQRAHYVLMICGSGGHTAEMIQMVERSIRPETSSHRRWAVGKDDEKSYDKILAFECRLLDRFSRHMMDSGTFDIVRFGRARYVHQSWLTTPFTAILSLWDIVRILITTPRIRTNSRLRYPGVIVTNGPGTGFLFLLVARILKVARIVPTSHMKTIYVESWARVKSLSVTGKLVRSLKLADRFIVQSRFLADSSEVLAENLLVMPQEPHFPFAT